jgi:hypothetical protein
MTVRQRNLGRRQASCLVSVDNPLTCYSHSKTTDGDCPSLATHLTQLTYRRILVCDPSISILI